MCNNSRVCEAGGQAEAEETLGRGVSTRYLYPYADKRRPVLNSQGLRKIVTPVYFLSASAPWQTGPVRPS